MLAASVLLAGHAKIVYVHGMHAQACRTLWYLLPLQVLATHPRCQEKSNEASEYLVQPFTLLTKVSEVL
jgi:hypothetical protein